MMYVMHLLSLSVFPPQFDLQSVLKHAFFKIRSYKKHKKIHDFVVFILKMIQELFFAFFLFQKVAENHKNSESF